MHAQIFASTTQITEECRPPLKSDVKIKLIKAVLSEMEPLKGPTKIVCQHMLSANERGAELYSAHLEILLGSVLLQDIAY